MEKRKIESSRSMIAPKARFGYLTVLEEAPRRGRHRYWLCQCKCGKLCEVEASHLLSGHTKSCGCLAQEIRKRNGFQAADLKNRTFGRLTALEPTPLRQGEAVIWRCRCECGNEVYCKAEDLLSQNTRSCGCLLNEQRKENMKKAIHFVDGTCIEKIACQRETAANTSGHRGVWQVGGKKWRAELRFRGKRYSLGTHATFEEAVAARLEGEQKYYGEFLESYYARKEQSISRLIMSQQRTPTL